MAYSFRFYGRSPSDWKGAERAEFSIQFLRTPTDHEKRALAKSFVVSARDTVVDINETTWLWSDRFVDAALGVRWSRGRAHLKAFTDFLMAARDIVPVADVTYLNALDGEGQWDRWSIAQQPPDPGPDNGKVALCGTFQRVVDNTLPEPTEDAAFQQGLSDAIEQDQVSKLDNALAKLKPGAIGLAPLQLDPSTVPRGGPKTEWSSDIVGKFDVPVPPTKFMKIGDGGIDLKREGDHLIEHGSHPEHPIAFWFNESGEPKDVVILDEGGSEPTRKVLRWEPEPLGANVRQEIATNESGTQTFIATTKHVYRVDRSEGRMVCLWTAHYEHDEVQSVDWLGDDRLLVLAKKQIVVIAIGENAEATVVAQRANAGQRTGAFVSQAMVEHGALIATTGLNKSTLLTLALGDKLTKVGELPKEVRPLLTHSGQLRFLGPDGVYRLVGLDKAVAKHAPKKTKVRAKKKTPGTKKPPAPQLVEVDDADLPPAKAAIPEERRASFPEHARLVMAGKRIVGISPRVGAGDWAAKSFPFIHLDNGDDVREITNSVFGEDGFATGLDVAEDGATADILSTYCAWRVNLDTLESEVVWTTMYPEREKPVFGDNGAGVAVAHVDANRTLVLGEKGLALMGKGPDGWKLLQRVKLSKAKRLCYVREHGYCVVQTMATTRFYVFVVLPTKLKKLMDYKSFTIDELRVSDGTVFGLAQPSGAWRLEGAQASAAFELALTR